MNDSQTIPNAEAFITTPFSLIANAVLEAKTDRKTNEQLEELTRAFGADSEIIKPLAALKAANDDEARDALIQLLVESGKRQMPLVTLHRDHAAMLAAKHGITNREVGNWRRRRVLEMASKGPVTDMDIEREVFIKDAALNQLTSKLVKDGSLVRDGEGYKSPESVTVA
jgi:hypothetical protein